MFRRRRLLGLGLGAAALAAAGPAAAALDKGYEAMLGAFVAWLAMQKLGPAPTSRSAA